MAEALGNPTEDPHGDPIPDAEGALPQTTLTPLSEVPVGRTVEIRRVDTSDAERLRYLAGVGLIPGTNVQVVDRQPFQGPLTLRLGTRDLVLGHEISTVLLCSL